MNIVKKVNFLNVKNILIIEIFIMLVLFILSNTILKPYYLYDWIAHNYLFYIFLCLLPLVSLIFGKKLLSCFMTIGIVSGVVIGEFVGSIIRTSGMKNITNSTPPETVQKLMEHKGFYIWVVIILFSVVLGLFFEFKNRKITDTLL